jgi:ATP-binding cassette subfamily F protein 3
LDITCQKTAEVFNKTLQLYDGNYTFFMAEKQRLLQRQEQMYEIQQTHLASEKALISRFRA